MGVRFAVVLVIALFSQNVLAALDSVGVFHRPEKVVVLISESGADGRLQAMMNAFAVSTELKLLSDDESIKAECYRTERNASCTFRFIPSGRVSVGERTLEASMGTQDAGQEILPDFEMYFESSREDKFLLRIRNGKIVFAASKKKL